MAASSSNPKKPSWSDVVKKDLDPETLEMNHLLTMLKDGHDRIIHKRDTSIIPKLEPVKQYIGEDFLVKLEVGQYQRMQLSEKGRHVVRGLLTYLINDMMSNQVRKDIQVDQIYANDDEVRIQVRSKQIQCEVDKNAARYNPIFLIHELCGLNSKNIPEDLRHLMCYLVDNNTFWTHRNLVLNHPCLWPAKKLEQIVCSFRICLKRGVDIYYQIYTATIEFSGWKKLVVDALAENHGWNPDFKIAADKVFNHGMYSYTGDRYNDEGDGFLIFLRNLFEHTYDHVNKNKDAIWVALEIEKLLHIIYPTFMCKLVSRLFYRTEFKNIF